MNSSQRIVNSLLQNGYLCGLSKQKLKNSSLAQKDVLTLNGNSAAIALKLFIGIYSKNVFNVDKSN